MTVQVGGIVRTGKGTGRIVAITKGTARLKAEALVVYDDRDTDDTEWIPIEKLTKKEGQ